MQWWTAAWICGKLTRNIADMTITLSFFKIVVRTGDETVGFMNFEKVCKLQKSCEELLPLLESLLVCEYQVKNCMDWTGQKAAWSSSSHWGLTRHFPETYQQQKKTFWKKCVSAFIAMWLLGIWISGSTNTDLNVPVRFWQRFNRHRWIFLI